MLIIVIKKMKNIEISFWFLLAQHDITDSVGATHNVARPLIILRAGVSSSLGGRRYSQFRIVRIIEMDLFYTYNLQRAVTAQPI